jgi:hypothetical protein
VSGLCNSARIDKMLLETKAKKVCSARPSYKRSLQLSKENIQHFKT